MKTTVNIIGKAVNKMIRKMASIDWTNAMCELKESYKLSFEIYYFLELQDAAYKYLQITLEDNSNNHIEEK